MEILAWGDQLQPTWAISTPPISMNGLYRFHPDHSWWNLRCLSLGPSFWLDFRPILWSVSNLKRPKCWVPCFRLWQHRSGTGLRFQASIGSLVMYKNEIRYVLTWVLRLGLDLPPILWSVSSLKSLKICDTFAAHLKRPQQLLRPLGIFPDQYKVHSDHSRR